MVSRAVCRPAGPKLSGGRGGCCQPAVIFLQPVEQFGKLADKIERRVEAATKRVDRLTQAVLAKAFRGELVPTEAEVARRAGREYEPASILLERIKAARPKTSSLTNGWAPGRKIFAGHR